ncbi:uncharacterized protein gogo [Hetaerina americana]|uniref:uncharacterized protein gogo n=1 Tax=Hetaerina americana TaxID=62018 RepID=UPI003A7F2BA6
MGQGETLAVHSRQEGEVGGGGGDASAAPGSGGIVRRDGELWIELVDMEMGAEKARRRRKEAEERRLRVEAAAGGDGGGSGAEGGGRRWRREEGSGGEGSGEGRETMGRREIGGGWNSVEDKEVEEDSDEDDTAGGGKKTGGKRYGWVAGGVRPKGERENAVRTAGKEAGVARGKGERAEGSGKWAGKLRWRSWNGRIAGFGGAGRKVGEGKAVGNVAGAREKKGDGGAKESEGKEDSGRGERKGEEPEGVEKEGGAGQEDVDEVRGLILETALVSRGWHLPSESQKGSSHHGPTPPHSTLALTFPASHFTHGGLYVVRLVGTGRVVTNPGTQRPQRDTATTEGAVESTESGGRGNGVATGTNKSEETGVRNGSSDRGGRGNAGKAEKRDPPTPDGGSGDEDTAGMQVDGGKDDVRRMYGRILEALENRKRWEEYDRGGMPSDRKSPGESTEGAEEAEDGTPSMALVGRGESVGSRRRREAESSSGSRQRNVMGRVEGPRPIRGDAIGDPQAGNTLPSEGYTVAKGALGWFKSQEGRPGVSHYGVGVVGEGERPEQWEGGAWGMGGRVVSESWQDREDRFAGGREPDRGPGGARALDGPAAEWGEGGRAAKEVSGTETRAAPSSFLRAYLEEKASVGRVAEEKGMEPTGWEREADGGANESENPAPSSPSGSVAHDHDMGGKRRRRRNEEGSTLDEPFNNLSTEGTLTENHAFTSINRSMRVHKREVGEVEEEDKNENLKIANPQEGVTDLKKDAISNLTAAFESRVSRDVAKGCKENCEASASRHILAEESVLVSWPAARFTLNILSSSSLASASKSKSEGTPPRNVTFETFEAPVRVLVEIPCGIEGVGRRSRREAVSQEYRRAFHVQGNAEGSGRVSDGLWEGESNQMKFMDEDGESESRLREGGEGGGAETKEITGAESSEDEWKPKRAKKGARGEIERLRSELEGRGEGGRRRKKRDARRDQSNVVHPETWDAGVQPGDDLQASSSTTERQFLGSGDESSAFAETENPREGRARIRKERVTKYDINDDALESLEAKAGMLGSSGYAMKREVRGGGQTGVERGVGGGSRVGGTVRGAKRFRVESWMRGAARERRDAGGPPREEARVKRAPTTAGSSRNPKTGLSPGPPKLPFRVFLVLRYCGVDSTECDEEDSGKENLEIWRRPQTVFTKELVDFPECPKYQHQVILPCEAFGQAGVYMVQVRSNYTLETEEHEAGKAKERRRKREANEREKQRVWGVKVAAPSDSSADDGVPIDRISSIKSKGAVTKSIGKGYGKKIGENLGGKMDRTGDKEPSTEEFETKAMDQIAVGGGSSVSESGEGSEASEKQPQSKGSAGDDDDTLKFGRMERKYQEGRVDRSDYENILRDTGDSPAEETEGVGEEPPLSRKPRGSAWEMGGSSWWEFGSGDGDSDDGSGDWGDGGWPEAGRGRREGSGDEEYGDDPEGGSGGGPNAPSRRKMPDPPPGSLWSSSEPITVRLSQGYVFTVHARSVFPCSEAHVRPETLEPAPSGVPVLFEYPECILEASDRVRVFGRARPDVAAILPPFWMGTDASMDAAVTLSHPSLRYVAEKKIYKGKHNAWFDCSLFTERFSEYCFAYASEALTGAVTHVRAQCIPTLPTSDKDRGGWGSWSAWSQCSTTCGSGSRNRYRTCDNPPPRYGAPFCEGTALETERCPPPAGVSYEELQEMCPLGLALNAADDANRKVNEPNCRCGGCVVHLQGVAGTWSSRNAGPIKPRARLIASSSQACPGRSFWLLQAEPGHVVGLTVSSLLLPCPRRQWLKARDGDSLSSRLILHLPSSSSTANGAPAFSTEALCFSSGPHMLLEFYSFERLEATCNGGFLAHAHQVLANSSASAIGRDILLTPTTRAVPRSSLSVHAAALAFILALLALSGGLALNYILRRRRFNEELKKREEEEEEMSDSDSDTKCFIARSKDGGSATSVTSVSDVISLRRLSVGKESKRREVHMRLTEESDEDEEEEEGAKANLPKVEVLKPGPLKGKRSGGGSRNRREGGREDGEAAAPEVTRRRRRKGGPSAGRREWRESACPLLEPEVAVAQSSISLPSSPTEVMGEDPSVTPNAPGRPGLSASAPLLLRRSLSFFAATASASSAGAAGDTPEGVAQSISAAGKQWWRKKMQRFQNGAVSPVHEELEETWRLAEPHSPKKETPGRAKQRPSSESIPPAKECKEKQNRERLMRAGIPATEGGQVLHPPPPPSSTASDSPSATTSPEMSRPGSNGGRPRGGRLLRARATDERGKCTSEASLAGGASELDLEFDYYDYNVQNAGAAPGSYLGMDPAFLVYIPPFEGSTSPSSNASSASTLQAPPSEGGTDALLSASSSSPPRPAKGDDGRTGNRGDYYCINPSYARANFQEMNGSRSGGGSEEGDGEMMSMAEFRRDSVEEEEEESEEGRGSEKETRVEKSPVEDVEELEDDEIKFADDDEEEVEEENSESAKMEGAGKYGVITAEGVGLKKPV